MLAGKHDVASSGVAKNLCPGVGIPFLDCLIEQGSEVVIVVVNAVVLAVVTLGRRTVDAHGVVVPLGVGIVSHVVRGVKIMFGMIGGGPAGDGVQTPMNKDAEF